MRKVVLLNDSDIQDITSNDIYKQYVSILEQDIFELFGDSSVLKQVLCPGCSCAETNLIYTRLGMKFAVCKKCMSHYVLFRPDQQALDAFYEKAKACVFWRGKALKDDCDQTSDVHGSRFSWIMGLVDEFLDEKSKVLDCYTKYPYLLNQFKRETLFDTVKSVGPLLFEKLKLLNSDISILYKEEVLDNSVDLLLAFEVLERVSVPKDLFLFAKRVCRPGALMLLTTASSTGLEYQVLGADAPNINPINRMNLLSLEIIKENIEDAGFELIEVSTPGRLDMEIIKNALVGKPDMPIENIWRYILEKRDKFCCSDLQKFLQMNLLSSHVRVAAQKR